jgi:hypothetical protein
MKCANSPVFTILAIAILGIGAFFLRKIDLNLHHIIRLKIYSTFFQLMALVMYVEVPWPPFVKKFTQIFYALSFNIEVAHPECAMKITYFDKLKMVVIAPVVMGILLVLLSKVLKRKRVYYEKQENIALARYYRKKWKLLRQVLVIFVTSVYTPVCYYALRMFEACIEKPGGGLVMAGDTSLSCTKPSYTAHVIFSWIALIVFGVGIPLAIVLLIRRFQKRHLLNNGKNLLRYGALYEWYNDDFPWFEAVSLTRKGLMLLPVTLLSNPIHQATGMMTVTLLYAAVIVYFKPFIHFPLRLYLLEKEVDFYNFIESVTAVAAGFDLLLGTMAALDTTREAASAIGVIFILVNSAVVICAIMSFEMGLRKSPKKKKPAIENEVDEEIVVPAGEAVIEAAAMPVNASMFRRNESLRRIGSRNMMDANFGVEEISVTYDIILADADAECQEYADQWFNEFVMMLESKAECSYGDAQACKKQLEKTRAKLIDECGVMITNFGILLQRAKDESAEEGELYIAELAQKLQKAEELRDHVLKNWRESRHDTILEKLNKLKDSHSTWSIGFHSRVVDCFAKESFADNVGQGGVVLTEDSALARQHAREHKKSRVLGAEYKNSLEHVLEENAVEKARLIAESEELLKTALNSNDFVMAWEIQESLKHFVEIYENDKDAIAYRLEPSRTGKDIIKIKMREKKVQIVLPTVALFSIVLSLCIIIAVVQMENAVMFPAWAGMNMFVMGFLCMAAARSYRRVIIVVIGLLCIAQFLLLYFAYDECFKLSMYRTTHEVPERWRNSEVYRRTYADWVISVGTDMGAAKGVSVITSDESTLKDNADFEGILLNPCMDKTVYTYDFELKQSVRITQSGTQCVDHDADGALQGRSSKDTNIETAMLPYPFDYSCSEANNVIVSAEKGASYEFGWPKFDGDLENDPDNMLPANGDDYLIQHRVTHMYGQCGGCSRSANERNREIKFDVAIFERSKDRLATLHNCFAETFQKKLDSGFYEFFTDFTNKGLPLDSALEDFRQTDYIGPAEEGNGEGRRNFWMEESGHCRQRPDEFFNTTSDDEGLRPLSFPNVYRDVDPKAPGAYTSSRSVLVDSISHCSSCREGFELVPLQKVNMLSPECVNGDECTTSSVLQQATGVCVRSFNAAGDDAIKELKAAVTDVYGDRSFISKGQGAPPKAGAPAGVSLERLETLSVFVCATVMVSSVITAALLYLVGFSMHGLIGIFNGKQHKTTEDAIRTDKVKLMTLVMIGLNIIFWASPNIWSMEADQSTPSKFIANIYEDKFQFLNTMSVDGSLDIPQSTLPVEATCVGECVHPIKALFQERVTGLEQQIAHIVNSRGHETQKEFCSERIARDEFYSSSEFDKCIMKGVGADLIFETEVSNTPLAGSSSGSYDKACNVRISPDDATYETSQPAGCRSQFFYSSYSGPVNADFWLSNRMFGLYVNVRDSWFDQSSFYHDPDTGQQIYTGSKTMRWGMMSHLWLSKLGIDPGKEENSWNAMNPTNEQNFVSFAIIIPLVHLVIYVLRTAGTKVFSAWFNLVEGLLLRCWPKGGEKDTKRWVFLRSILALLPVFILAFTIGNTSKRGVENSNADNRAFHCSQATWDASPRCNPALLEVAGSPSAQKSSDCGAQYGNSMSSRGTSNDESCLCECVEVRDGNEIFLSIFLGMSCSFSFLFFLLTTHLGRTLLLLGEVIGVLVPYGMLMVAMLSSEALSIVSEDADSYISWEYQMHFWLFYAVATTGFTTLAICKVLKFVERAKDEPALVRLWSKCCCCCRGCSYRSKDESFGDRGVELKEVGRKEFAEFTERPTEGMETIAGDNPLSGSKDPLRRELRAKTDGAVGLGGDVESAAERRRRRKDEEDNSVL